MSTDSRGVSISDGPAEYAAACSRSMGHTTVNIAECRYEMQCSQNGNTKQARGRTKNGLCANRSVFLTDECERS